MYSTITTTCTPCRFLIACHLSMVPIPSIHQFSIVACFHLCSFGSCFFVAAVCKLHGVVVSCLWMHHWVTVWIILAVVNQTHGGFACCRSQQVSVSLWCAHVSWCGLIRGLPSGREFLLSGDRLLVCLNLGVIEVLYCADGQFYLFQCVCTFYCREAGCVMWYSVCIGYWFS